MRPLVSESSPSPPPRVAIDLRALVRRPTGIGVHTLALLGELKRLGRFELLGLAHRPLEEPEPLRALEIPVEIQPAPLGVLWQQAVLPRRLARGDIDLFWSPLLTLPLRPPVPAVVTLHDLAALHVPETLTWKVRWSLLPFLGTTIERAAAIVTVSETVAAEVLAAFPAARGKVVAIPNGVDPAFRPADPARVEAIRARLGAPRGYLLYAGTLEPRKNVELLLDAWETLALRAPDATLPLLLAGPDGWKSAATAARIAALAPRGVRRLGRLTSTELIEVMQAATIFVYPSLYEGFGLPVAEAMACGVPVVTSDRSCLPEIVGDAGLTVDPEDAEALVAALERLLEEGGLAARLAAAGVERSRRYSWPVAARRLADLFDRVLGRAGAPAAGAGVAAR